MNCWRGWVAVSLLLVAGCSLPRIVVLNDPLDARQHNDLGVAYQQRGDLDLAERSYRRAADLDRNWAQPLVNLGNVSAREGDWPRAIEAYREAVARQPASHDALNNLAWALAQDGRPDEALSWARQAVAAAAEDPQCWDTLAQVYLALGRSVDAHEAAARGLALNPAPPLRTALEEKLSSP